MSLASLTAHQISKAFGLEPLLQEITFSINAGERVGLIGPNGSGKTTLLRILTGQEQPDSGHVALSPNTAQVGYLAQGFEPAPHLTLAQLLHQTVGDPATMEAELAQLGLALADLRLVGGSNSNKTTAFCQKQCHRVKNLRANQ